MAPSSNQRASSWWSDHPDLTSTLRALVEEARSGYRDRLLGPERSEEPDGTVAEAAAGPVPYVAVAPGRVNLIGEHTDYTGGFVLPLALRDHATVVYGTAVVRRTTGAASSTTPTTVRLRLASSHDPSPKAVWEYSLTPQSRPPRPEEARSTWIYYVVGVVAQYLPDVVPATGRSIDLAMSVAGNVPVGSGLSSSASLEVATARFVEAIWEEEGLVGAAAADDGPAVAHAARERALRCQRAENTWCHSPCGIMDQYVSSAAQEGALLWIDCATYDYQLVYLHPTDDRPVLLVTDSQVKHDIGGGEYPVRVRQCQAATAALKQVHPGLTSLREATLEDLQQAQQRGAMMDDALLFRRARHVVTENSRVESAQRAAAEGDWPLLGALMKASHDSLRDDYQVSCDEVDLLVQLAADYPGVYGSRITGGGFGGCMVTLVRPDAVAGLQDQLTSEYRKRTGKDCLCYTTTPGAGCRLLGRDKPVRRVS